VDIGVNYFYRFFNAGVWYRGIPFKQLKPGYSNSESVAFLAGMELPEKGIKVGYSYDYTLSSLAFQNTGGAHELSIIYELYSKEKKFTRKKSIINNKF
jgi:hypothetical protein